MADAPDIFISYRRGDAASAARLHRNNIHQRFGSGVSVFLDVRDIPPGEEYADDIRETLRGSKLMLAVAGRNYVSELQRREHEVDWVREELIEARRSGIPIWPVLVNGQQPFDEDELPEAVRWLAGLNAITIPTDTSDDGERLLENIGDFLTERKASLGFEDRTWDGLVQALQAGTCVPIIGTDLGQLDYSGPNPITLQRSAGDEATFSMFGGRDLPRVAQALATLENDSAPRQKLSDWAEGQRHDAVAATHPYAVLAGLGLPMYVSTSYEDGLARAVESAGRHPQRILYSARSRTIVGGPDDPTADAPIVLQLMGDYDEDASSLVVTEDDFFHLLVKMVTDDHFFPIECLERLTQSSLLFVGFELSDWRFRVLLRGLVQSLKSNRKVYAVVSAPRDGDPLDEAVASRLARNYLTRDVLPEIRPLNARVHYGGVEQFSEELADRLGKSST
jgi:hypothetical protein